MQQMFIQQQQRRCGAKMKLVFGRTLFFSLNVNHPDVFAPRDLCVRSNDEKWTFTAANPLFLSCVIKHCAWAYIRSARRLHRLPRPVRPRNTTENGATVIKPAAATSPAPRPGPLRCR